MSGQDVSFSTQTVWAGLNPEQYSAWDLMPPISVTATYKQQAPGKWPVTDYSRFNNPTRSALQDAMAQLDNGKYGFVFSSGMAAVSCVVHLLNAGDHVILTREIYPGVMNFFDEIACRMGIEGTFVDMTDLKAVEAALRKNTKLIWIESCTNPTLEVPDIKAVAALARRNNPDVLVTVDNTFVTPYFLRPLEIEGVDIAMMSLSKYINGHADIIMGCVVVNDPALQKRLYNLQILLGATPPPNDCYQVIRSLKTLHLRMEKHKSNGLAVATFLENHPKIKNLNHPLLKSHKQQGLALKQNKGHSGMIFCEVDGTKENVAKFAKSLKVATLATSLGGVMTTVAIPKSMTTGDLDPSRIEQRQMSDTALRISIGLEDVDDLIRDFDQALKAAFS